MGTKRCSRLIQGVPIPCSGERCLTAKGCLYSQALWGQLGNMHSLYMCACSFTHTLRLYLLYICLSGHDFPPICPISNPTSQDSFQCSRFSYLYLLSLTVEKPGSQSLFIFTYLPNSLVRGQFLDHLPFSRATALLSCSHLGISLCQAPALCSHV